MSEELVPLQPAEIEPFGSPAGALDIWEFLPGRGRIQSSLDRKDEGHRTVMAKALANPDVKGDAALNQPFNLVHVLTQIRQSVNRETGEVTPFPYVCLIDDQTTVRAFGSVGVLSSIGDLMAIYGPPPWVPPVPVRVVSQPAGEGRRVFRLVVEGGRVAAKKGGKQ